MLTFLDTRFVIPLWPLKQQLENPLFHRWLFTGLNKIFTYTLSFVLSRVVLLPYYQGMPLQLVPALTFFIPTPWLPAAPCPWPQPLWAQAKPSPPLSSVLLQLLSCPHAAFPSRNTCIYTSLCRAVSPACLGCSPGCPCAGRLICAVYGGFQLFCSCFSKQDVKHLEILFNFFPQIFWSM